MKRLAVLVLALCATLTTALAEGYERYYTNLPVEMPVPALAEIPDRSVLLTDFGAVGDGVTLNTAAIQKAIDTCAAAGGGQ